MQMLIVGLALFLGLHLVPAVPPLRTTLQGALGVGIYKLAFSLGSAAALVAIVLGFRDAHWISADSPQLWTLPDGMRHLTMTLMWPAFILLASAYIPSRIRTAVKHPMLASITLWAAAHLLVRGDLASVLLFGSFLAYSIVDRISAEARQAIGPLGKATGGIGGDIAAITVGTVAFAAMLLGLHGVLIGISLLPEGTLSHLLGN